VFDFILSLGIRLASAAVLLGWVLSALGQLNGRGYLCAGLPLLALIGIVSLRWPGILRRRPIFRTWIRWWRRRRILPLIYLATFGLIVAGSIWHEPNNFDSLNYHIPRVFYWLAQHRWYWINTPFPELNYTFPNHEWLTLPFFLATNGFHSTVVINWLAFLGLPSLLFSLLRSFGVPGRLAFDWMWIFPSGYLIAMEAGGTGNDLIGLTTMLAALHCANRFVTSGMNSCLFDALLAAGFFTGVKISNLPLAVFVLIILFRRAGLLRARWFACVIALALAALVSALVPALLNRAYSGSILGITTGCDQAQNPVAGWLGNGMILFVTALAPPLFPGANHVTGLLERLLGPGLDEWLKQHYTKFTLRLNELPQEETGGLGLGITLALVLTLILRARCRKTVKTAADTRRLLPWQKAVWWGWLGFAGLVILARLGTGPAIPRNLLPWFPVWLAPVIAFFGCDRTARTFVWRILAPLISLSIVPALLVTPSRPLIPPSALLRLMQAGGTSPASLERVRQVYDVYASRVDPFTAIKNELPPDVRILGLISDGNEPRADWWKPYGSRWCLYLQSETEVAAARKRGMQYIVIKEPGCAQYFHTDTAHWLETHQAQPVKTVEIRAFASLPPFRYTLARFETRGR